MAQNSSDVVELAWERHFGGEQADSRAYTVSYDGSGNVYVGGVTTLNETNKKKDYLIIKYNAKGQEQWIGRYNGPANKRDELSALLVDDLGNVYGTGTSDGGTKDHPDRDFATVKYDSEGLEEWVARYSGFGEADHAIGLAVDGSGNIFVTGRSNDSNSYFDYATVKYNSEGVEQWVARYSSSEGSEDRPTAMAVDGSGNIFVTGKSRTDQGWDYVTIKYNTNGVEQWIARFDGEANSDDEPCALTIDNLGNVYVTGRSIGANGSFDYLTVKYKEDGSPDWIEQYSSSENSNFVPSAIKVDGSENVYITGSADGANPYYLTIRYNKEGSELWTAKYSGLYATALAIDNSGNVYVTGNTVSKLGDPNYRDFSTIKYNTNGGEEWAVGYTMFDDSDDAPSDIKADGMGNIYVSGTSRGNNTRFTTIKYVESTTVLIEEVQNNPTIFSLAQNYPNPFNPQTTIAYDLPANSQVTLKIYDLLGQEVKTLVDDFQTLGQKSVTWNGRNNFGEKVSSGLYFYKLQIADRVESRKMLLLK